MTGGAPLLELRDAWAEALGEERMAELERGLRELRSVLWADPE